MQILAPTAGFYMGIFFLYAEPGAPFFPSDEEAAKSLYMKEIPLSKSIEVIAGLNFGLGEIILSNAKKV